MAVVVRVGFPVFYGISICRDLLNFFGVFQNVIYEVYFLFNVFVFLIVDGYELNFNTTFCFAVTNAVKIIGRLRSPLRFFCPGLRTVGWCLCLSAPVSCSLRRAAFKDVFFAFFILFL